MDANSDSRSNALRHSPSRSRPPLRFSLLLRHRLACFHSPFLPVDSWRSHRRYRMLRFLPLVFPLLPHPRAVLAVLSLSAFPVESSFTLSLSPSHSRCRYASPRSVRSRPLRCLPLILPSLLCSPCIHPKSGIVTSFQHHFSSDSESSEQRKQRRSVATPCMHNHCILSIDASLLLSFALRFPPLLSVSAHCSFADPCFLLIQ